MEREKQQKKQRSEYDECAHSIQLQHSFLENRPEIRGAFANLAG
jgi:hypothetical protein